MQTGQLPTATPRLSLRANSRRLNLEIWDRRYLWPEDGDEWKDQAAACGQPYAKWKRALINEMIRPYLSCASVVVEIGPGHGRWTQSLIKFARMIYLVDLSPSCLEFCRRRFKSHSNIYFHQGSGADLRGVPDGTVDFVWSYDVFVHMARMNIAGYFLEIRRVLKTGGHAVIHHANRKRSPGAIGPRRSSPAPMSQADAGWRSRVSSRMIANMADTADLRLLWQTDTWGPKKEFHCKLHGDCISGFENSLAPIRTPSARLPPV